LVVYFFLGLIVVYVLVFFGRKILVRQPTSYDIGKKFIYECGFKDLNDQLDTYTIQFFMIRISFILFDLEIILIIPIVGIFNSIGLVLFFFFIIMFFIGLVLFYELAFLF